MAKITLPPHSDAAHLRDVRNLALELMDEYGLLPEWTFKFDRAHKRAGQANLTHHVISLSAPLMSIWPMSHCRDTILHEIAHALTGPGHKWRAMCRKIGADPTRTWGHNGEERIQARYVGTCPNGHVFHRERLTKRRISCRRCNPRFDERYLITWKRNNEAT